MKIVIPMAGEGSRFKKAGYTFPKPLIDVGDKPMIQRVIENLDGPDTEFIFLARQEHLEEYKIKALLNLLTDGRCKIVPVAERTEGAACTVLLAKEHIDCTDELIVANCDQIVRFSRENFNALRRWSGSSNLIFTFRATHPKWSFAECDAMGKVIRVAEKVPISDIATCGIYHFRRGSEFVTATKQMITQKRKVNNEYYVCPVYNELINNKRLVLPFFVDEMHGIGTPEDLEAYKRSTA